MPFKLNIQIFILIFCLFHFTSVQSSILKVTKNGTFGINAQTGDSIRANSYTFSNYIFSVFEDTLFEEFYAVTREISRKGTYFKKYGKFYAIKDGSDHYTWRRSTNYVTADITFRNGMITIDSFGSTYRIDRATGKNQWRSTYTIKYLVPERNFALGIDSRNDQVDTRKVVGFSLLNGRASWERYAMLPSNFNAGTGLIMNDSTVYFAGSGVHSLNLNNGKGWSFRLKTQRNSMANTVNAVIKSIESNLLFSDSSVYYAGKTHLAKLSLSGDTNWLYKLPKRETSSSVLLPYNNDIVYIGLGYGLVGYLWTYTGRPFIAAFDSTNGNQKYKVDIPLNANKRLFSLDVVGDRLFFTSRNRAFLFNLQKGVLEKSKSICPPNIDITGFIPKETLLENDTGGFTKLVDTDTNFLFVHGTRKTQLSVNKHTLASKEVEQRLYFQIAQNEKFKLYKSEDEHFLLDRNNLLVSRFSQDAVFYLTDRFLFALNKRQLVTINLNQFNK